MPTNYVSSFNGLTGPIGLTAGSNIVITQSGQTFTISSTASGGSGSGKMFYYQASAPTGVTVGDRWMDSNTGIEFVYVFDGDTSQWMQPTNSVSVVTGPQGPTGSAGATGATGATGSGGGGGGSSGITDINTQTGTSYSIVTSDLGKLVTLSNASPITVTIPPNSSQAFAVGSNVYFTQLGVGMVGFTAGSGVTLLATPGQYLRTQYSAATAIQITTDTWLLSGDLSI